MEEIKTKVCNKCGRELPIEMFSKGKNKDGLQRTCKECVSVYMKEYAERRKAQRKEKENAEFEKEHKIYTNKDLAKFSPRDLILELKARGYRGSLVFEEIVVNKHIIDMDKFN